MRYFTLPKNQYNIDNKNYVIVHIWPQTDRNPTGHASITIVCGDMSYHVSYWHERDITQCEKDKLKVQYDGIAPFWVDTLNQDCLIEGYRHAMAINPKLNAKQILEIIDKEKFDQKMLPVQSITLFSLDVVKIRDTFLNYKKNEHKWAFFSGYLYHASGAHNCSSIVLFLLYQGGMGTLVSGGYGNTLRQIALITGLLASPFLATTFIEFCAMLLFSGLTGSAVGGIVDGYQAAQPFLRVCALSKKDSVPQHIGITICAMLVATVQSLLFQMNWQLARFPLPGNVSSFTLPGNVLSLAMEAKKCEIDENHAVLDIYPAVTK